MKKKRILVDMSATIIHNGHIRLLKKASKLGSVIVGLTRDREIYKHKGYKVEIKYEARKEILESIVYVNKVIPSNFYIDEKFLKLNKIDILVHGNDNPHKIKKKYLKIFPRTSSISSTIIRQKTQTSLKKIKKKKIDKKNY